VVRSRQSQRRPSADEVNEPLTFVYHLQVEAGASRRQVMKTRLRAGAGRVLHEELCMGQGILAAITAHLVAEGFAKGVQHDLKPAVDVKQLVELRRLNAGYIVQTILRNQPGLRPLARSRSKQQTRRGLSSVPPG
jgi:hypothetical protein